VPIYAHLFHTAFVSSHGVYESDRYLLWEQGGMIGARVAVPKLVKNGYNSPFVCLTSLRFPFRVHVLTCNLNAESGLLTTFNHFRNTHARYLKHAKIDVKIDIFPR